MSGIKDVIAVNIMRLREAHKMSKRDLAAAVGVSPMAVTHWERAANSPDIETLVKVCDLFGVTLSEIYGVVEQSDFMQAYHSLSVRERRAVESLVYQLSQHDQHVPKLNQEAQDELAEELTRQYKEQPHSQTECAE